MSDEGNTSLLGAQDSTDSAAGNDQGAQPTDSQKTSEQPDDQKQSTETKDDGKATDEPVVPESYKFELPEGFELDDATLGELTPVFRDLKLTQEAAQKLVTLHTAQLTKLYEKSQQQFQDLRKTHLDAVKTDKEYGGKDWQGNIRFAQEAMKKFGTPELKQALVDAGLDNHPELVRVFYRIGKAISEDSIAGTQKTADDKTPANSEEALMNALLPNTMAALKGK